MRCLVVRRVTQDNRGKNDCPESMALPPSDPKSELIWLPASNPDAQAATHPSGLDSQSRDRRAEAPRHPHPVRPSTASWSNSLWNPNGEARFEPNSYGFRPGRACSHDAIELIQLFQSIKQRPKYVLDADIAKCFDRIAPGKPCWTKLNTFPRLRRLLKGWLRAWRDCGPERSSLRPGEARLKAGCYPPCWLT